MEDERIVPRATGIDVIAGAAVDHVVTALAEDRVVAGVAADGVVAVAPVEVVVRVAALDRVVEASADCLLDARQRQAAGAVVAALRVRERQVDPDTARDVPIEVDGIEAGAAVDRVAAIGSGAAARDVEVVVAVAAAEGVVAGNDYF